MTNASVPDYTALELPSPAPDRPYVLINMVMSADGKVTVAGNEHGLGSPADKRLMQELRANADVILNGAGTMRATGASPRLDAADLVALRLGRGLPRYPTGAVLSRSGDLPLGGSFYDSAVETLIFLADTAPAERRRALLATGRPVIDVPADDAVRAVLRHMRGDLGARVLLVEGGPDLNAALFAAGAVDELFLTVGPMIVGGRETLTAVEGAHPFPPGALPRLSLVSTIPNTETSELYLRYRVADG